MDYQGDQGHQGISLPAGRQGYQGHQGDQAMGYLEHQGDQATGHQRKRTAGFMRLWIWQEAHKLNMEITNSCKTMPREERFRLRDQIERSSSSIKANIAEGYASYYYNDKIKSMNIARKEAGETQNHILSMKAKGYISPDNADSWIDRYERLIIGINNYKKYVLEKREASKRKGSRTI